MSTDSPPRRKRPVAVTIAVVLIYISGLLSTALGILILLSRYQVTSDEVLVVSLVGSAVILFGLLTISAASSIARGSALARLLVTIYVAVQFALSAVTIAVSDRWDWTGIVQPALIVFIVVALWAPRPARYFSRSVSAG